MNKLPPHLLCASANHSVADTADGLVGAEADEPGDGGQEEKAERSI